MKRNKRLFCLLLAAFCLFSAVISVQAAPLCSLTVTYEDGEYPLVGALFQIYLVAARGSDGSLVVQEPFTEYHVNITDNPAAWPQLAATLAAYVDYANMQPVGCGLTDQNGCLTFGGLAEGLYLVVGDVHFQNERTYFADPALVSLPGKDVITGETIRNVVISPKSEWIPDVGGDGFEERKVLKVWKDSETSRPLTVTVHLLQDGEVYDTVILSQENFWRYLWTDLPAGHQWQVVEEPVPGYTVTVSRQGITFVVTNTEQGRPSPWEPQEPTESESPDVPANPDEVLPQTGQPWSWVLILTAAGLLFLVIGLYIRRGNKHEA